MSNRSARTHPAFFDRTPLLLGVMIIPLAASCALLALSFPHSMHRMHRDETRSAETRFVGAERDRREGMPAGLEDKSSEDHREDLHSPPVPPAVASRLGVVLPPALACVQPSSFHTPAVRGGIACLHEPPRGPPAHG